MMDRDPTPDAHSPMPVTLKSHARLAALGALGVSFGAFALFGFVSYFSRATALGGIDATQAWLTWISLAVPFAAIIAAHVVYARILFRYARDP